MTIRKRNDSVKPGMGIDGTEGEDFTRRRTDPWDSNPDGNFTSPSGAGRYQNKNANFLNNKMPYEANQTSYDIWDSVEGQSSDSGNRAVKSKGQP